MKISYLEIEGYKNLEDIFFNFENDVSANALIGNNGSGKSNVLETLACIFTAIYSGKYNEVPFKFTVDYSIDSNEYSITNNEEFSFTKNDKKLAKKDYVSSLPSNIFMYYCGETQRFKNIAEYEDNNFEAVLKKKGQQIKFASFICLDDFELLLISSMRDPKSKINSILKDLLNISSFGVPITFEIVKPEKWGKNLKIIKDDFWKAHGTVKIILDELKDVGELVVLNDHNAQIIIEDSAKLYSLSETSMEMFIKLKLLMQVGVLKKVSIKIVKDSVQINAEELSEGEKQLAMLISLLETTKEYKPLFLLDEFDSYLHPKWQRRFAEIISDIGIRGQIIFTTHSPMTLGKMKKESIRILRNGEAFEPLMETYNRDIIEVLEQIMEVGSRPQEVERLISQFKKAAIRNDFEKAKTSLNELRKILSLEDPFWITSQIMIAKIEVENEENN